MAPLRKIVKACARCRRRKERCDGRQPTCSPCIARGSECAYNWHQKKRGLPEGWVHTLEKLLALAMAKNPDLEQSLLQSIKMGLNENVNAFAALWTDDEHDESLRKRWRSSLLASELSALVHQFEQLPRRKLVDESSDVLAVLCQKSAVDGYAPSQETGTRERRLVDDIPVPPNILEILELYFLTTHSWMPVVGKQEIYQLAYRLSGSWAGTAPAETSCLLAILSCSTALNVDEESNAFGRLARKLLPQKASDLRPSHAQALLILSVARMQNGKFEDAWLLVGEAWLVTLLTNKLQLHPPNGHLNRIVMGCFILDMLLSCRLQLAPRIHVGTIPEIQELAEDSTDEWCPSGPCFQPGTKLCPTLTNSSFNRLFQVARLLSRATTSHQPTNAESLYSELELWKTQSSDRSPLGSKTKPPMLPSQIAAHVVYLSTMLSLQPNPSALEPDLAFQITMFCTLLKDYVKSTIQRSHIPAIWDPIFAYLLYLLQERILKGDHASRAAMDALIAVVAEMDGLTIFKCLKKKCAAAIIIAHVSEEVLARHGGLDLMTPTRTQDSEERPTVIEVLENHFTSLPGLDFPAIEQQAQDLTMSDTLNAAVDWDETLRNLGYSIEESDMQLGPIAIDTRFS